jgi:hypothetical protein
MMRSQRGNAAVQVVWAIAGIVVIVSAFMFVRDSKPGAPVAFTTPYQAVLLANGPLVYYGKLEGYGTLRPVLTDVYVIVSQTNSDTKQTSNTLIKLDKVRELHQPDRMYLNPTQILAVEPVASNSKVGQLLAQAH